jgi:hypothetical protein
MCIVFIWITVCFSLCPRRCPGSRPKFRAFGQPRLCLGIADFLVMLETWEAAAEFLSRCGWVSAGSRRTNCEGAIILDRLPSKSEAVEIRDILGIPKRIELSEEVLVARRAQFSMVRKLSPVLPAFGDAPAIPDISAGPAVSGEDSA